MKKNAIIIILLIIITVLIIVIINKNNKINISEQEKQELMLLLGIEKSSSFLPISIYNINLGFGDTSECYVLKFEISIADYNENLLNYNDTDTTEISLNWKEEKDEETYICYIREWEYNEQRKDLFEKLKSLKTKNKL
ncbi:MAG TPA: hypothetical protein OIM48_06320 [Clostridiaceae bacterium]|jgi:hypothetical protein|nr:hypothetical protein [Clostridiaceae bacterium]